MNKWYSKTTNTGSPHEQGLVIDETTGRNVAVTYDPKDAPLIAAAPEMKDALDDANIILDSINRQVGGKSNAVRIVLDKVRAARIKATPQ